MTTGRQSNEADHRGPQSFCDNLPGERQALPEVWFWDEARQYSRTAIHAHIQWMCPSPLRIKIQLPPSLKNCSSSHHLLNQALKNQQLCALQCETPQKLHESHTMSKLLICPHGGWLSEWGAAWRCKNQSSILRPDPLCPAAVALQ